MKVSIKQYAYPNGTAYWQVSCTLPTGVRHKPKFTSLKEAETERFRLLREAAGAKLTATDLTDAETALFEIRKADAPICTMSLAKLVTWAIANYPTESVQPLRDYAEQYLTRKQTQGRSPATVRELKSYLNQFCAQFGHMRPSEITAKQLDLYLSNATSRYSRDKVLRAWFDWMSGASRRMASLERPPLTRSQFNFIDRPSPQQVDQVQILYLSEVKTLIQQAIGTDMLGWVVWGLFTGMRPEAEMRRFWRAPTHQWNKVDLHRRVIHVSKDLEKTRRRSREIVIQPNLMDWIAYFKATGTTILYSRRKLRELKTKAYPNKANVQDILRHTFISNFSKIAPIHEVCFQAATSQQMIRTHYLAQIADPKEVEAFWNLRPANFGLKMPTGEGTSRPMVDETGSKGEGDQPGQHQAD
jgi:hypothetical protein